MMEGTYRQDKMKLICASWYIKHLTLNLCARCILLLYKLVFYLSHELQFLTWKYVFTFKVWEKHVFVFNFWIRSIATNIQFLLKWNIFFKRYTRILSILNFGISARDFHTIALFIQQCKSVVAVLYKL